MTYRNETIWKCERCKVSTTVEYGEQPDGWVSIRVHVPPNHSDHVLRMDLCEECESAMTDFMYSSLDDCEHQWPDELTADADCWICGLSYNEWSE